MKDLNDFAHKVETEKLKVKLYHKTIKLYSKSKKLCLNFTEELKEVSIEKLEQGFKNEIYLRLSQNLFKEENLNVIKIILENWMTENKLKGFDSIEKLAKKLEVKDQTSLSKMLYFLNFLNQAKEKDH